MTDLDPECDLCGGEDFSTLLEKKGAHYLECQDCGFIRTDLSAEEFALANEEFFVGNLAEYAAKSYTAAKQRRYVRRLHGLEAHRGAGRLLEIGSNVGGFVHCAKEYGWRASGVEPVEACARHAREERGLDVVTGTLGDADFEPASFDVVYSNAVFEHLTSPRTVLEQATALLKPGGVVFIDTVNFGAYTRRFIGAEWKLIDPLMHACLYTPATLRKLCEDRGLEILRMRSHRVRLRPESSGRLRGAARWLEEARKLPWSVASRLTLRGESLEVLAIRRG